MQPFLDFVHSVYGNLQESIVFCFGTVTNDDGSTPPPIANDAATEEPSTSGTNNSTPPHLSSMRSFRVLTECPLIVMLLFQLYPTFISTNIPTLVPHMMNGLSLRPTPTSIASSQPRYKELIACQVKSLSFLTYLLRGFSNLMLPHRDAIARSVVALMRTCPESAVGTRKEVRPNRAGEQNVLDFSIPDTHPSLTPPQLKSPSPPNSPSPP